MEYTKKALDILWTNFFDIPVSEDSEYIEIDYHIWESGTELLDIWRWFDYEYSKHGTCLGKEHF